MTSITTSRRQGLTSSAAVKVSCKAATTAAITRSGEQTIDGVSCVTGDRVLVKEQASGVENGIYVVDTGAWERDRDFDGYYDVRKGTLVFVHSGSTNQGWWYVSTADTITVGTTSISFTRSSTTLAVVSAYAQTLLDDTTAAAARATLGVSEPFFDVDRYGAVGDGSTDDTAAIQAAVDAAEVAGGVVWFNPTKRYVVTDEIIISSIYPVHLMSAMGGDMTAGSVDYPGIIIGGNITGSMFLYTAPDSGVRAAHGGGTVRGLAFYDATWSGSSPGSYTCTAALELNDFALSAVEDCYFHGINGSAILGEFVVMSHIRRNHIRYCGATSQPAIYLPSTSATYPAQATTLADNRIEVNHDAPYIQTGANSSQLKFIGNGFEADTAVADSNQNFIQLYGTGHTVVANHFNRNSTTQLNIQATSVAVAANNFEAGNSGTAAAIIVAGNMNALTGNVHRSGREALEYSVTGNGNSITGNVLYASGGIRVSGSDNNVSDNSLYQLACTTAGLGAGDDYWIDESGTPAGNKIAGNLLNNSGGTTTTVGGVKVLGTVPTVLGNTFRAFAGSGNGAVCIRCETANATVAGNSEANCTTFLSTTSYAIGFSGNFQASSTDKFLWATATYDPANLVDGAGATTSITVTGAALGDFAEASFSLDLQGITLTAYVSAGDAVSVRFQNETGGAIDLASGTLKVMVHKR